MTDLKAVEEIVLDAPIRDLVSATIGSLVAAEEAAEEYGRNRDDIPAPLRKFLERADEVAREYRGR